MIENTLEKADFDTFWREKFPLLFQQQMIGKATLIEWTFKARNVTMHFFPLSFNLSFYLSFSLFHSFSLFVYL